MNDDLESQIQFYDTIHDYHAKMLFIEKLLHYYEHASYTSNQKEICCIHWKKTLDELYWFAFTYL